MALPDGPIHRVAFDEIIAEDYGDSVAQSLNNLAESYDQVNWQIPVGTSYLAPTTYVSTGTLDVWFVVGGASPIEVTIPDWAHHALVYVSLNGIALEAVGEGAYDVQVSIGGATGRRVRRSARQTKTLTTIPDDREWFGLSWFERLATDDMGPGDRRIRVRAGQWQAGSSKRWLVDSYTDVAVFLTFQGAIRWYTGI